MAFSFPRISITVDDGNERGTQGELGSLSFGFGVHLAWSYSALFGSAVTLGPNTYDDSLLFNPVLVAALISFAVITLFTSITDQRLLRFYTARSVMILATGIASLGSLLAMASYGGSNESLLVPSGILMGCGAALLTMLWGTAFARFNTASIVLNSSVAVVVSILCYSLLIHLFPWPFSGVITIALPLLELPLLWRLTPVSYALRHAVPIFNPLPIRRGPFMLRMSLPILLFGFALGALKEIALREILPSSDPTVQLIALFAGGTASIVLLVVTFSVDKRSHWDFLFRPLVPFVAVTILFLPWFQANGELVPSLLLLTGFLCLEALMWILLGQLAQEFRLSPICVFGIGATAIALGTLAGILLVENPAFTASLPFGTGTEVVLLLIALMLAMALLPRVRDIRRLILPHSGEDDASVAAFNKEIDQAKAVVQTRPVSAWSIGLEAASAYGPPIGNGQARYQDAGMVAYEPAPSAPAWDAPDAATQETLPQDAESDEERAKIRGRFRTQCETIANRYLLSRRETEVMFLLAKGHNAAFIQDKLCISKSTAKTHISHIYRKLDIHNQQELLAMVDAARKEASEQK